MRPAVLRVALDVPMRRLFDYLPPGVEGLNAGVAPVTTSTPPAGPGLFDAPNSAGASAATAADDAAAPRGSGVVPVRPTATAKPLTAATEPAPSSIPPTSTRTVLPGQRVQVPFGRQRLVGLVVGEAETSDVPADKLKPVLGVLDSEPMLDRSALELIQWASDYYHHPIGEVVAAAIPKALREGAAIEAVEQVWTLTPAGQEALAAGEPKRAPKQKQTLELLHDRAELTASTLGLTIEGWQDSMRALVKRGWVTTTERPVQRAAPTGATGEGATREKASRPRDLAPEQREAVDSISESIGRFGAFVLHGITGSGKTEVYLQVVEQVLARGQRALVLVPEIGLTPQLVERFEDRFQVPLSVLHSALTDSERLEAWRAAFSGHARIVLGTRSAVFAPVRDLGVIVVDEEHDASYKQHEGGFRYSARDLAVVRAQQAGVPVVLGSATPALETLQNVNSGRYQKLVLPRRAAQAVPPRTALIDLRVNAVEGGISTPAVRAIERHLEEGGQVLVFLNRRGYAPTLLCTACGWVAPCKDCDARLTVHRSTERLRCHHCGADAPLPARCVTCGFPVKPVGQGTERIEETLSKFFPGVPLVRLDRDVVRKRGDMESAMARMHSGEARILVGTQMVTKGHHFPNVTLVVVLNADQGLFSTDFRAPERLAQTLIQVAGRAGRGEKAGEVLIQTEFPEHPMLNNLLTAGYDGFAAAALSEREQASWPPFSRLAAIRDSAPTAEAALEFLREARALRVPPRNVQLRGPVPAAMAKRAGRYHAQLLLESADRASLHRFLNAWLPEVEQLKSARKVRWALDVDPIELF